MNGHQKMFATKEVANLLPALDLPPTPSPKLKALFLQRVHKQGCPQEMHVPKQCFNHKNKGKFHIGMSYVVHTAERRKLTTTW